AVKPFGAIDTPAQGGSASGSSFRNHGWVLTPMPNCMPTDGSTIGVYIDGIYNGTVNYSIYRPDVAGLFPGYCNSNLAHGYFDLNTTAFSNGVHTIAWIAGDDAGNADGIGSRYFTVGNAGARKAGLIGVSGIKSSGIIQKMDSLPFGHSLPFSVKKGFKENTKAMPVYPDKNGIINIHIEELERVAIAVDNKTSRSHLTLNPGNSPLRNITPVSFAAYQLVGTQLRELPTGATLDAESGVFYWQPGPGFIGEYRFVFITAGCNGEPVRNVVSITILPKYHKGADKR
ncbi:MAG: hypothetical protein GY757_29790, partial [bacterium]|nr:hypothetical protein [bacterium]